MKFVILIFCFAGVAFGCDKSAFEQETTEQSLQNTTEAAIDIDNPQDINVDELIKKWDRRQRRIRRENQREHLLVDNRIA